MKTRKKTKASPDQTWTITARYADAVAVVAPDVRERARNYLRLSSAHRRAHAAERRADGLLCGFLGLDERSAQAVSVAKKEEDLALLLDAAVAALKAAKK